MKNPHSAALRPNKAMVSEKDAGGWPKAMTYANRSGGFTDGKDKTSKLSAGKAMEMLHNPPGGKALTKKQRGYFGAVASGKGYK